MFGLSKQCNVYIIINKIIFYVTFLYIVQYISLPRSNYPYVTQSGVSTMLGVTRGHVSSYGLMSFFVFSNIIFYNNFFFFEKYNLKKKKPKPLNFKYLQHKLNHEILKKKYLFNFEFYKTS